MVQPARGSYILLIQLSEQHTINIGNLGTIHFLSGYYAYVGSAMKGFKSRLSHHVKVNKKVHWHIDYLLSEASIREIILCETRERAECIIAQALGQQFDSIPRFGSSDCRCKSHLFFAADEMKSDILGIMNWLDIKTKMGKVTK